MLVKPLHSLWGQENSDPAKVAQVVLRLASSESLPPHLLIGSDAIQFAGQAEATRAAEAQRWLEVSVSTDVDASGASLLDWKVKHLREDFDYALGIRPHGWVRVECLTGWRFSRWDWNAVLKSLLIVDCSSVFMLSPQR